MDSRQKIQAMAKEGAVSVFGQVARQAEVVPEGIRWQTVDYKNDLQYGSDAYNGISGISLFLSDYYHLFKSTQSKELAQGAVQWCIQEDHRVKGEGLYLGMSGIGLACLRYAIVTGDATILDQAEKVAEGIMVSPPGPGTELFWGAAGRGIFMLRLWEATQNTRYLTDAIETGKWLNEVAIRNRELGCIWLFNSNDEYKNQFKNLSFGHGTAGIGYFFAMLFKTTQQHRWHDIIEEIKNTLDKHAKPDQEGNWGIEFDTVGETAGMDIGQWCNGAPGVGLFYCKAYDLLKEPAYLEVAKKAGETAFAYGDWRKNPTQCHGLAGNAELFIELYRVTQDTLWIKRAGDFGNRAFAYRQKSDKGDIWQADEPGHNSPDFMCGAAGTGHFFLRLYEPDKLSMPFMYSKATP